MNGQTNSSGKLAGGKVFIVKAKQCGIDPTYTGTMVQSESNFHSNFYPKYATPIFDSIFLQQLNSLKANKFQGYQIPNYFSRPFAINILKVNIVSANMQRTPDRPNFISNHHHHHHHQPALCGCCVLADFFQHVKLHNSTSIIFVSSVRSSSGYHGLIEIRQRTHFFRFFKFFRF